jgi:Leucine-rich repeat (LRR) protein
VVGTFLIALAGQGMPLVEYDETYHALTAVPGDIPSNVNHIDLSHNRIVTIRQSDYSDKYPELSELLLFYNNIRTVEQGGFRGTVLSRVTISYNFLTSVPDFSQVKDTLTVIILNNNKITRILQTDFNNKCTALQILLLKSNSVGTIERGCFQNTKLEEINLESNQLTEFPDFYHVKKTLKIIKLSKNHICTVTADDIPGADFLVAAQDQDHRIRITGIILNPISRSSIC